MKGDPIGRDGAMKSFVELVRLEQTLFALPFAYAGMLLAGQGFPSLNVLFWVSVAMFGARTAGMCANRIIDKHIDAANPRTADRALPAGRMNTSTVAGWMLLSLALLVKAAYQLNPLCAKLSPIAVFLLLLYSYTKRFTWASHLVLGLVQACAPIGGWLAVTGSFHPVPLLLGLAIFLWVAGFDVLYACQDLEHDKKVGLYSIPARFGPETAFRISEAMHAGTLGALTAVGLLAHLGNVYYSALGLIGALLVWEHTILKPNDLSRIQHAFFTANVTISTLLLASVIWEVCL